MCKVCVYIGCMSVCMCVLYITMLYFLWYLFKGFPFHLNCFSLLVQVLSAFEYLGPSSLGSVGKQLMNH